jgi:hypothetical protein
MMLLEKNRTTLGGDILPVQRVDIPALCSPGMLVPFPLLELFDLSGRVLANAWFIGVGADDDELPLLEPYPKGMYVTYPYLGSHCDRVLVLLLVVIRYTRYLITTRYRKEFLHTVLHIA